MSTLQVENLIGPTSGSNANKVIIPSGQTLYAPGHVIQVVEANFVSNNVTSSTSFVATDITASITPTSSSSKILVSVTTGVDTNSSTRVIQLTLYRNNTTNLMARAGSSIDYIGYATNNAGRLMCPITVNYTDSPNTTSSVTYTLYHKSAGSYQTEVPGTFQTQQITLQEIAQ